MIGFRPELWHEISPADMPNGITGFNQDIRGVEGFTMPSTQHDAVVWLSGSAYDIVFDIELVVSTRSRSDWFCRRLGKPDAA